MSKEFYVDFNGRCVVKADSKEEAEKKFLDGLKEEAEKKFWNGLEPPSSNAYDVDDIEFMCVVEAREKPKMRLNVKRRTYE